MIASKRRSPSWWVSLRPHLLALAGYVLLTALFTYPMILGLRSTLVGIDHADPWEHYWNLWWVKQALLELRTNPFHTGYLFHPMGASLHFHTLNLFNGLLTLPVQELLGLPFAHNFGVFFSLVLGGYGTFLLVDYVVENKVAAFVSGMIFAFSPFHAARVHVHLSVLSSEWIPFYVLFCIKALRGERVRNAVLASVCLVFVFLSLTHYALFALLFTGVAATYYLWRDRTITNARRLIGRVILIVVLFGILSGPVLVSKLGEALRSDYPIAPAGQHVRHSADLLEFFRPSPFHPLWGDVTAREPTNLGRTAEHFIFVGFTPLVLAGLGATRKRFKTLWFVALVFFFVMALGPLLHINGRATFTDFEVTIPLPYILLYYAPFVAIQRTPARTAVMVMLALAVLAGLGLDWLLQKVRDKKLGGLGGLHLSCALLAGGLVFFEFLAVPFPSLAMSAPAFYEALAEDQADYAVLDVPVCTRAIGLMGRYMFLQTVHEKAIFGGHVSRRPPYPMADAPAFLRYTTPDDGGYSNAVHSLEEIPAFRDAMGVGGEDPPVDIVDQGVPDLEVFGFYGFKYVVVHKYLFGDSDPRLVSEVVHNAFEDAVPFFEDDEVVVYETVGVPSAPILSLGDNWYASERSRRSGELHRWMATPATLNIFSPYPTIMQLELRISDPWLSESLEVYLNEQFLGRYPTRPNWKITVLLELDEGENVVGLVCPEGNFIPAEVDPRSKETRRQIMAFREVKLVGVSDQLSEEIGGHIGHRVWRNLGDVVSLLRYDMEPRSLDAGESVGITLWWQALVNMDRDYTAFVHVLGPEGRVWAQQDKLLQRDSRATSAWRVGEIVREEYELPLPADIPPGEYRVVAGVYYWGTGQRLPVWDENGEKVADDAILLGPAILAD